MASLPFHFEVPPGQIAQEPIEPRDQARLLVLSRAQQAIAHRHFFDLPEHLKKGDLLVLNDTRVLPARLVGKRGATGGKWQGLFLKAGGVGTWEMLSQTRGHLKEDEIIVIDPPPLELKLVRKLEGGRWLAQPNLSEAAGTLLEQAGRVPLPPYIRKGSALPEDRDKYQTLFARRPGAVAAPTAGLHFTTSVFDELARRGIAWVFVTLHVGLGTFLPMQSEDPAAHVMHTEWGEITPQAARTITECQGRIVAVGTTSVRVLETVARGGAIRPWSGETDLFIHPPFRFGAVDALITNFHFPQTTLLLLVSAFAGGELLERAYQTAITEGYRFFSYGDAMLIQ